MSAQDFAKTAADLRGMIAANRQQIMSRVVITLVGASKQEAPRRTGRLSRSIAGRVERGGARGVVETRVPYAQAVHDGTKPHIIRPRPGGTRARALFWRGARHPVRLVRHPGTKANPYYDRALRSHRSEIERELESVGTKMLASVGPG